MLHLYSFCRILFLFKFEQAHSYFPRHEEERKKANVYVKIIDTLLILIIISDITFRVR